MKHFVAEKHILSIWDFLQDHHEKQKDRQKRRRRDRDRDYDSDSYRNPVTFYIPPFLLFVAVVLLLRKYGTKIEKIPKDILNRTLETPEQRKKREQREAWNKFWKEWIDFFVASLQFIYSNPQYLSLLPVLYFLIRYRTFLFKVLVNPDAREKTLGEVSSVLNSAIHEVMKQSRFAMDTVNDHAKHASKILDSVYTTQDRRYQDTLKKFENEMLNHAKTNADFSVLQNQYQSLLNEKSTCFNNLRTLEDYIFYVGSTIDQFNIKNANSPIAISPPPLQILDPKK